MGYKSKFNLELLKRPTKEFCYILGYLWADGHLSRSENINKISLQILKDDAKEIAHLIESTGVWLKRPQQRKNRKPTISFNLSDKFLKEFLIKNDFYEKSVKGPTKLKEWMGEKFFKFFIHGFIDGDGNVSCCKQSLAKKLNKNWLLLKFTVYGSIEQCWAWIIEEFQRMGINKFEYYKRIRDTGRSSSISICGKKAFAFLKNIFVSTNFIGLKRKIEQYIKYEEYINRDSV